MAVKHPQLFHSVSAFAPICAPTKCPWGEKAFSQYLGEDRETWKAYDSCELIRERGLPHPLLVDQGTADDFLESQLHPHLLEQACAGQPQPLKLHRREAYDHSYFFIASFMEGHIKWHREQLGDT